MVPPHVWGCPCVGCRGGRCAARSGKGAQQMRGLRIAKPVLGKEVRRQRTNMRASWEERPGVNEIMHVNFSILHYAYEIRIGNHVYDVSNWSEVGFQCMFI